VPTLQAKYPRLSTTHRSHNRNFMTTLHVMHGVPRPRRAGTAPHESQQLVAVKGSPAEVLQLSVLKQKSSPNKA
jgi:hypothetical protein